MLEAYPVQDIIFICSLVILLVIGFHGGSNFR